MPTTLNVNVYIMSNSNVICVYGGMCTVCDCMRMQVCYYSMFILSIAMMHPLSHPLLSAWSPPMACCDFGIWELQLSNYEIPSPEVTSLKIRAVI